MSIATLKVRLGARTDREHEQALLRFVLVGLVLAYVVLFVGPAHGWSALDINIAIVLAGLFVVASGIFAATYVWPATNVSRRLVGMVLDAGLVTLGLWGTGAAGMSIFGVYFFVIFGNGFRYGHRYLYVCLALCVMGFSAALVAVPYWQQHLAEGFSLLLMLVLIPLYVSVLVQRIHQAHAKADQALNECLEREKRAS